MNGELYGDGLVSLDEGSLESTDNGKQDQNCNICEWVFIISFYIFNRPCKQRGVISLTGV